MTNLKLVTFNLDNTQFLVSGTTYEYSSDFPCVRKEAIARAVVAHIEWAKDQFGGFGDGNPSLEEVTDGNNYSVEDVDMELLLEIITRKDWYPSLYYNCVVFKG